jgi:myosin heavy subunit
VKSGFLQKRNEQGTWQKRFLCIVPHMFLYYFDSEVAEAPRGVIDLELYQSTEREEKGGIKLVAGDETLRSFHFNDDDEENLNEWATSLVRDRYHLVCEERNAYQQMQSLMTGAIDNASSAHKSSEKEREQLESQLAQTEKAFLDAKSVLQNLVLEFGVSDEEMGRLTDVQKIGLYVKQRIGDLRDGYERKLVDKEEVNYFESCLSGFTIFISFFLLFLISKVMHNQQVEYGKMTEEFLKKMENEQIARKNLEALILKERKEAEKKVKEAEAQIDNITLNFQMAVAAKTSTETKVNTLNDQKKLLVKEVKQLRKRVDELSLSNDEMKSLNDRLLKAAGALKRQIKTSSMTSSPKAVPKDGSTDSIDNVASPSEKDVDGEASENTNTNDRPESPSNDNDTSNAELEELLSFTDQLIAKSEQANPRSSSGDRRSFDGNSDEAKSPTSTSSNSNPIHRAMNTLFRSGGSETDIQDGSRHVSEERGRNDSDDYDERASWEMPPMALRELGWLSEEQSKLMDKRLGDKKEKEQQEPWNNVSPSAFKRNAGDEPVDQTESNRRGSTLSMFTGGLLGSSNTPPGEQQTGRRSSLMSITSMFKKDKPTGPALSLEENANLSSKSANKPGDDSFFTSPFSPPETEEADRLPTAMRLHCLRCKGTVEGPKFSTCKCSMPALTPDDLSSDRLPSLSGMMRGWGLNSSSSPAPQPKPPLHANNTNEISL